MTIYKINKIIFIANTTNIGGIMENNHNSELLNAIFKNVTMATHALDSIKDKFENKKLLKLIDKQNSIYEEITAKCNELGKDYNIKLNAINPFLKMTSSASIGMKTIMNDETNHIAEMLIQGTTMGITDVIKSVGEFNKSHNEIKNVATNLQHAEEEFVDSLKTFLVK